tara:strand:- start:2449 stop:2649 length:201 start_codon:yes stop_codon:yes gene_type:complete
MRKIFDLQIKYKNMFGEHPPIFGYPDDLLEQSLIESLENKTPMKGYDEVLNEELNISDDESIKIKI